MPKYASIILGKSIKIFKIFRNVYNNSTKYDFKTKLYYIAKNMPNMLKYAFLILWEIRKYS